MKTQILTLILLGLWFNPVFANEDADASYDEANPAYKEIAEESDDNDGWTEYPTTPDETLTNDEDEELDTTNTSDLNQTEKVEFKLVEENQDVKKKKLKN